MPAMKLLLATYTVAVFLSAALLFAIQPMFAKMVLPTLGGSPAVWSVAMVFFQAMLLAGYAYAHALTRLLPGRASILVHLVVTATATLALPLSIAAGWGRPPEEGQALWLLGLFAASIGLPFFALAANGPLLQAWFARTEHPAAKDPYFLYAASNLGSFLALLAYPFVIEPFTRLGQQARGWSVGFYAMIVLIAACGAGLVRSRNALPPLPLDGSERAPSLRQVASWIALTAVPSGLLIAVTAHISTDVAAAPFLWVIPLALYLATFVIVFQTRPLLPHRWMVAVQPFAALLMVVWYAAGAVEYIVPALAVNILGFFVLAMVCHGELVRRRPPARHLTAFYLCMAIGGLIGGIFAGLVALHVFSWVVEYPLLIVLAVLCRPGLAMPRDRVDAAVLGTLAVAAIAMYALARGWRFEPSETAFSIAVAALVVIAYLLQRRTLHLGAAVALAFVFIHLFGEDSGERDFVRSFYGVHKVLETDGGQYRILKHGTIEHGAQRIRDAEGRPIVGRPQPLTYYYDGSPMAQGIAATRERRGGPIRIAVVGLGTGTLACHTRPGDSMTFYEIDAAVVRIARDPNRFTYISSCAPDARTVVGDARLTLADAPDGAYDVLVIDAFSSDAIPTHLLTREAMAVFARKVAADGMIMMHVTNRHLSLAPVVAGTAHANGLIALTRDDHGLDDPDARAFGSTVVAVARRAEHFGSLQNAKDWLAQEPEPGAWVWTDDYSNVIGAMIRHMRE